MSDECSVSILEVWDSASVTLLMESLSTKGRTLHSIGTSKPNIVVMA